MNRSTYILALALFVVGCTPMGTQMAWTGVSVGKVLARVNGSTTNALIHTAVSFVGNYELRDLVKRMQNRPDLSALTVTVTDHKGGAVHAARMGAPGVTADQKVLVKIFEDGVTTSAGFMEEMDEDRSLEVQFRIAILVETLVAGSYTIEIGGPGLVPAVIKVVVELSGGAPYIFADEIPSRASITKFLEPGLKVPSTIQANRLITLVKNAELQSYSGEKQGSSSYFAGGDLSTVKTKVVPSASPSLMFYFVDNKQVIRMGDLDSFSGSKGALALAAVSSTSVVASDVEGANQIAVGIETTRTDFEKTYNANIDTTAISYLVNWYQPSGSVLQASNSSSEAMASAIIFGTDKVLGGGGSLTNHEVLDSFKKHDLSLAVRGIACMTCHGKFNGTIVTDEGHGSPYFIGGGQSYPAAGIYGVHGEGIASAQFFKRETGSTVIEQGKLIVPKAPFPQGTATLKSWLDSILHNSITVAREPGLVKPLVEEREVYIGAPTTAEITAAAGTMPAAHPEWKYLPDAEGETLTGLEVISIPDPTAPIGGGFPMLGITPTPTPTVAAVKKYVRNVPGQSLKCTGDLFILKPVVFKNLTLETGNYGCRLYVNGSVFIMGPIAYPGTAVTRHIQITSDRMISLGLGNAQYTTRMNSYGNSYGWHDRRPGTTAQKMSELATESLGLPLEDASTLPGRLVPMDRVILNAPQVHSRNLGEFEGIIIAEVALMALGAFEFKSPDFIKAGAFPLFPRLDADKMLKIGDTVLSTNTPAPSATPTPTFGFGDEY